MLKDSFKKNSLPQTPSERGGLKKRHSSLLKLLESYSTLFINLLKQESLFLHPVPLLWSG
jgi:hypothetical protein